MTNTEISDERLREILAEEYEAAGMADEAAFLRASKTPTSGHHWVALAALRRALSESLSERKGTRDDPNSVDYSSPGSGHPSDNWRSGSFTRGELVDALERVAPITAAGLRKVFSGDLP